MSLKHFFVCALCAVIAVGCGEKAKEAKDAIDAAGKIAEAGKTMEKEANKAEARREERRKRGDTLAMDYKKLQEYLPADVAGYKAEEPEGQMMNMTGMSFSSSTRRYSKNEGAESIEVTLIDYNATADLYNTAYAFWSAGLTVENNREITKTFDPGITDSYALEHFDKEGKNAEVTYALGGRFILTIKAGAQSNCDFVKNVAKSMKLGELASK